MVWNAALAATSNSVSVRGASFYSRRPNVYIKLSDVRKLGCPWIATLELKNEVRRYSTSGHNDNAGEIRYWNPAPPAHAKWFTNPRTSVPLLSKFTPVSLAPPS